MNAQEIFDTVARHLFTQGEWSRDHALQKCMYRDDDGRKCAVGCLIPDDMYRPVMDEGLSGIGTLVLNSTTTSSYKLPVYFFDNIGLLDSLQRVHDNRFNWRTSEHMRQELFRVAAAHNLDSSILVTLNFKDR